MCPSQQVRITGGLCLVVRGDHPVHTMTEVLTYYVLTIRRLATIASFSRLGYVTDLCHVRYMFVYLSTLRDAWLEKRF